MSRLNANFESSLEKVGRTIGRNFGLQVRLQGNTAYTDGTLINLPVIEEPTDELMADLNGFLDHEVAHCKFTKMDEKEKCLNRFHAEFLNAVEDSRIEIRMAEEFPGCGLHLDVLNAKWQGKMMSQYAEFPTPIRLIVALRRAYEGSPLDASLIDERMRRLYDAALPHIMSVTYVLSSLTAKHKHQTTDLRLATEAATKAMMAEREKIKEEEKQAAKDKDKAEKQTAKDKAQESSQAGEGEGADGESEKSNSKGKGKKSDSSKDKGEKSDDGEDADLGEFGDDETEKTDESKTDESDSSKGKGEKSEESEESEESEDDDDGDESEDDDDTDGEEKSNPQFSSKGAGDDGDKEEKQVEDKRDDAMMSESPKKAGGKPSNNSEFDKHVFNSEQYVNNAIAAEVKDEPDVNTSSGWYTENVDEAVSLPFTTQFDTVTDYSGKGDKAEYARRKVEVMPMVNPIRATLERVLVAKEDAKFRFNRERGMIDTRAISRLIHDANFREPFKDFTQTETRDVAVELLMDLSGSMSGEKLEVAKRAVIAIGESLMALNIAFEVTGFKTGSVSSAYNQLVRNMSADDLKRFNRTSETLDHFVFKSFDTANLSGICEARSGGANCDGESVKWAAQRLAQRPESRKILLVFSDGQPASGGNNQLTAGDLKRTVRLISKSGIECVGFGIQTECVDKFYPDFAIISDLKKLPAVVFGKVAKILERSFNKSR